MTRQKQRVATDTWRSFGCRTTPLEHWSKRKPTVEPRWAKHQTTATLLQWLSSYFLNRNQRVLGGSSNWLPIEAGVQQGSILVPLFFIIYINDNY